MSLPAQLFHLTVQEYLEFEEKSDVKHEYVAGRIFVMAGATEGHNLIVVNVTSSIRPHLRGSGCRVYTADMKVRIELADTFYYPDVMVTCEPFALKSVFKSNPCLIVEVLSPSTENTDRREKLSVYRQLESLREYAIVYQDRMRVELYRKDELNQWQPEIFEEGESLSFGSLPTPLTVPIQDIYEDVVFE
jgi:Uma2 family endonuclease